MNAPMLHAMTPPLAPFVDALPLPSRMIASERDGRLTVGIRAGTHRFHRDLPVSSIWGFEGMVPGPTIEAERGRPVTVEWRFGDGASLAGGPGRPYGPGLPPADAVVRVYQTRCLPGDQGRNPYVLPSCSSTGYPVDAIIVWRITFSARGPIDSTGTLPTRTTATSIAYPVSEARGFLTAGGSQ